MGEKDYEELERKARDAFFNDTGSELGCVVRVWDNVFEPVTSFIGVMPENIYRLSEHDIGIKSTIRVYEGSYSSLDAKLVFIPYNECNEEQRKLIDEKRKKLEKFRKKVSKDKSQTYDKPGTVNLHVLKQKEVVKNLPSFGYEVYKIASGEISEQKYLSNQGSIKIHITQRELADAGVLPEDIRWKEDELAQVSEKDIAEADKALELTSENIGMIDKLLGYIKSFFKGKGEK